MKAYDGYPDNVCLDSFDNIRFIEVEEWDPCVLKQYFDAKMWVF